MADDDEVLETGDEFAEVEEDDAGPGEIELDEEALEDDLVEEDEFGGGDEEFAAEEPDDDDEAAKSGPVRRSVAAEDEDDDDDMVAPDDVEADLDTILKDRLVANDDEAEDDEDEEPEERGDTGDRIQPKRADEELCPSCFLLVRQSAPGCPVADDECPLFT